MTRSDMGATLKLSLSHIIALGPFAVVDDQVAVCRAVPTLVTTMCSK